MNDTLIQQAAQRLRNAKRTVAFTGAGISVESGIPPFRGPDGLWSRYDPIVLDLDYFQHHPEESWRVIKEIFYDFFGQARPNAAHRTLARLESAGYLQSVITQNIDNLHQEAGSRDVIEFHGTSHRLTCLSCGHIWDYTPDLLNKLPPACPDCGGLLRPDFVFFGEGIPPDAYQRSLTETHLADTWLVIGTTGEIMPASLLPIEAKRNGAVIIEVNIRPSNYTNQITDIFLPGKATKVLSALGAELTSTA
ncbi:MAG: NAD-dependent deacylase [Anaerolineales bacterium]|nr:NAD-dependent deacylase [Anaerolineales bacterium]